MTFSWSLKSVATAVVMLSAGAGCATNTSNPPPSATPSATAPSAPSSSSAAQTPSEAAANQASATVARYYAAVDELGQQPDHPLTALSSVAVGVQLAAEQRLLMSQRKAHEKQVGDTKLTKLEVQSVNLDNSNPSAGNVPTVQIDVCWDVAHVDVVDANGKSIVSSGRPDSGWTQLTVANYHYATDPAGGWRVATGQDLKRKPCAAS